MIDPYTFPRVFSIGTCGLGHVLTVPILAASPKGWYKVTRQERSKVQVFCGFSAMMAESPSLRHCLRASARLS